MNIKLSDGNHKLDRRIKCWSLPPIKTCPKSTDECENFCYALKSWKQYPNVRKAWNRNLKQTKEDGFVEAMVDKIKRYRKLTAVRIHVSGDFYSQDYFDKWVKIANKLPEVKFYSYTRVNTLDLSEKPDNLVVILSHEHYTEKDINKYKSKGFDGIAKVMEENENVKEEEFVCPYENGVGCGTDDDSCDFCLKSTEFKKIVFYKH